MPKHDDTPGALGLGAHEDEHSYQKLLDTMPDAVMIHGIDGRIVLVNQQAEALFGYTRAELLGVAMERLMPERFRVRHVEHRAAYMQHPAVRPMGAGLDLYAQRKDGSEFPVEISLSPTELSGDQFVITTIRDVTERKEADRDRQRLYEAAQEAVHVRNVFLSAISHDLGNPVAAVRMRSRMLREEEVARRNEPTFVEGLEQIEAAANHMWQMIEELLDLARLQMGRELELNWQETDLAGLVGELVSTHQATAGRHTLRLELGAAELRGEWDRARLERVINNLLSNAVKYSPAGGEVIVRLAAEADANRQGGWAVLEVEDRGMGIPEADLPLVFDRFHRGANVGHIGGTGIGLASARQIVEQHGGLLTIESQEGRGTRVTIRLPRGEAAEALF